MQSIGYAKEGECATSDIAVVDERAVVDAKASVTNDPIYLWEPPLLLVDGDAHLGKTDEREPALRDWHRPVGPLR